MKRTILTGVLILSLVLFATSCKEDKKSAEDVKMESHEQGDSDKEMKQTEIAVAEYQCPMNCEGDKTYHEPGSCPVCKMDLKEVKKDSVESGHENHDHK